MKIFIIVPSLSLSGPIKGALALANSLNNNFNVTLVFLKTTYLDIDYELNSNINYLFLGKYKNFYKKNKIFNNILKKNDGKKIIFSMCFSADLFSLFLDSNFFKISSIRSNLFTNYFYVYNIFGYPLAILHLALQNFFNITIVMNEKMKKQVNFFSKTKTILIENFIDEEKLKPFFCQEINVDKPYSYVFVGSLTQRKNPFALIKAFEKLLKNEDLRLHIVGDGPLRDSILNYINHRNLKNKILIHGFLNNPYKVTSESDVFILPSLSEGTPRAALEALYLGIPIIIRDVECNSDLINNLSFNGYIFQNEEHLGKLMLKASKWSRGRKFRSNLLPENFRSKTVIKKYQILFENLFQRNL